MIKPNQHTIESFWQHLNLKAKKLGENIVCPIKRNTHNVLGDQNSVLLLTGEENWRIKNQF